MKGEYYIYERMFKGHPMGIAVDINKEYMEEAEMFFNTEFKDHIEEVEELIGRYEDMMEDPEAQDEDRTICTYYDNDALTISDGIVSVYHIQGNEETLIGLDLFKDIVRDMKDKIKSYNDREHTPVAYIKDVLNGISLSAGEERMSFPLLHEEEDGYDIGVFTVEVDVKKRTISCPKRWCLIELTGDLLDFGKYPEEDQEYSVKDEGYSEAYLDMILDLFDGVRYELLETGTLNQGLYDEYLERLLKAVPEDIAFMFSERIGKEPGEIPETLPEIPKDNSGNLPKEPESCIEIFKDKSEKNSKKKARKSSKKSSKKSKKGSGKEIQEIPEEKSEESIPEENSEKSQESSPEVISEESSPKDPEIKIEESIPEDPKKESDEMMGESLEEIREGIAGIFEDEKEEESIPEDPKKESVPEDSKEESFPKKESGDDKDDSVISEISKVSNESEPKKLTYEDIMKDDEDEKKGFLSFLR